MMNSRPIDNAEEALAVAALGDALGRDRSHALVLAVLPIASAAKIPSLLAQHLTGSLEVEIVTLAGLDADAAVARILADGGSEPAVTLDTRLLARVAELSQGGSALVLALPDAASIPPATLRRLGRLASASAQALRLALFVECDAAAIDTTATRLVGDLGTGVEKIVLAPPVTQGARPPEPSTTGQKSETLRSPSTGPPRVEPEPGRRKPRSARIRVRRRGSRRHTRTAGWAVLGILAALQVAWWSGPTVENVAKLFPNPATETAEPTTPDPNPPDPLWALEALAYMEADPNRVLAALQPRPIAQREIAALAGAGQLHPVSAPVPATAPEPMPLPEEPAPSPAVTEEEAAPIPEPRQPTPVARVRRIPVNMNAHPWARIEVDGRPLGTTPLADAPLEPGSHRVVAHFPDGRVLETQVEVDAFSKYFRFP